MDPFALRISWLKPSKPTQHFDELVDQEGDAVVDLEGLRTYLEANPEAMVWVWVDPYQMDVNDLHHVNWAKTWLEASRRYQVQADDI